MWAWIFDHSGIRWLYRHTDWAWVDSLYLWIAAQEWAEEEERLIKSGFYKDVE